MKLHVPYFSEKSKVLVRDEVVEVKAFQIIVWVSITDHAASAWDPRLPKFPAILDIGTTHNFALTDEHLLKWAGIHSELLPTVGTIRKEGLKAALLRAGLWLHSDAQPFKLDTEGGIAVFESWPRLPVLGLRALTNSKLQTFIYGDTKQVVIRTPPKWYWPF